MSSQSLLRSLESGPFSQVTSDLCAGPVHSQLLIDWREQHPDAAEAESYIPHTGDVEKGSDAFAER